MSHVSSGALGLVGLAETRNLFTLCRVQHVWLYGEREEHGKVTSVMAPRTCKLFSKRKPQFLWSFRLAKQRVVCHLANFFGTASPSTASISKSLIKPKATTQFIANDFMPYPHYRTSYRSISLCLILSLILSLSQILSLSLSLRVRRVST